MHLTFTRLDDNHYHTVITRRDGVSFHVRGVGSKFAIPHDLAHLAIEAPLQLHRGFWGSIADGAVFESMTHLHGRRKPHAAERSEDLLRANRHHIGEAERLVSIFNDALEGGHGPCSPLLRARLREFGLTSNGQPRSFTDQEIAAVCDSWREMFSLWTQLPIGGRLELVWTTETSGRRSRKRDLRVMRAAL